METKPILFMLFIKLIALNNLETHFFYLLHFSITFLMDDQRVIVCPSNMRVYVSYWVDFPDL